MIYQQPTLMNKTEVLTKNLSAFYDSLSFPISKLNIELEGLEYDACQFELNEKKVIYRRAKVTPKKQGLFVTFWKRNEQKITTPFSETDKIDFYVIHVKTETQKGQFVFPKDVLIAKGIISTPAKDGKRGFRVYPKWDSVLNKQAIKTQVWQLKYFYEITGSTDWNYARSLYEN
jgi:hypothetical protein